MFVLNILCVTYFVTSSLVVLMLRCGQYQCVRYNRDRKREKKKIWKSKEIFIQISI